MLRQDHVDEIRKQFFFANAMLFKGYQTYMEVNKDSGDVEFNTEEFMKIESEKKRDFLRFYENLFKNENYREPV